MLLLEAFLARKLCNIIFTILRENSPYRAAPPKKTAVMKSKIDRQETKSNKEE